MTAEEQQDKRRPYKVIVLHSWKTNWELNQEGKKVGVYEEYPIKQWIVEDPPTWPQEIGHPPDELVTYIATAFEPMDIAFGGFLLQVLRHDPEARDRIALRIADEMLRISLADAIVQGCKDPDMDRVGAKATRKVFGNLLRRKGGDSFCDNVINDVLNGGAIDLETRKQVGIAIMKGLAHLLLRERAERSRSLIEYSTMRLLHGIAGDEDPDRFMGHQISLGLIVPEECMPVAPPEETKPIPEDLAAAWQAAKERQVNECMPMPDTKPPIEEAEANG